MKERIIHYWNKLVFGVRILLSLKRIMKESADYICNDAQMRDFERRSKWE